MKHQATCILNHRITTGSLTKIKRWWESHEHPEIVDVTYDDEGNVASVVEQGSM